MIVGATITAGHDGQAEMVVHVRHENGVVAPVVLDGPTGFRLMADQAGGDLTGLVGRSWRDLLKRTLLAGPSLDDDDNDDLRGRNHV